MIFIPCFFLTGDPADSPSSPSCSSSSALYPLYPSAATRMRIFSTGFKGSSGSMPTCVSSIKSMGLLGAETWLLSGRRLRSVFTLLKRGATGLMMMLLRRVDFGFLDIMNTFSIVSYLEFSGGSGERSEFRAVNVCMCG